MGIRPELRCLGGHNLLALGEKSADDAEAGYVLRGDGRYESKDGRWYWADGTWLPSASEPPRRTRLNPFLKFVLSWPVFWIPTAAIAFLEGTINAWIGTDSMPGILAFIGGFIAVTVLWWRF